MAEFLPICDVLFTAISLACYFSDIIFDLIMAWALANKGRRFMSLVCLGLVMFSLIVSQIVSLRWYFHTRAARQAESNKRPSLYRTLLVWFAVILHVFQMGVLWRYAKLFIPVDLTYVKHEVRDLCMLRLVHAFCEAAPMLLIQAYLLMCPIPDQPQTKSFSDLNYVSATLSLVAVCWALASFSKNVRLQNVHRLVLTWLGVIFQFLWRLGTVSARVMSLTVYASLYAHWVFLVIGLHWVSMFFWLISPKNVFHGERISKPRKACLSALIAFVYVFAYVNLLEVNHRQKMVTFYVVMMLENALLVIAWLAGTWNNKPKDWYLVPLLVVSLFGIGLFFMFVYYRYFHVRRLDYEAGGRLPNNNYCISCNGICECGNSQSSNGNGKLSEIQAENQKNELNSNVTKVVAHRYHQHAIPGVFNCRFSNPVASSAATKRKKKKPTTFVPPPTISLTNNIGPAPIPFWRKPLPTQHNHQGGSSENEGSSVGSRVNIHQKLQEKKQKQLAELKIIEEEIKQGKLGGPNTNTLSANDETFNSLPRQPIPRAKKHVEPICWPPPSPDLAELTDLVDYSKNLGDYEENLTGEMNVNTNINGNLNKLSTYKQNIGDLNNVNLNNLSGLNNLTAYGGLILGGNLNTQTLRISPSQNLNSLGVYSVQNINTLESLGSGHSSRSGNQNHGDYTDLGGLSPILGSDSGSLSRQVAPRLQKKSAHNNRSGRRRTERVNRNANMSPRKELINSEVMPLNPRNENVRITHSNANSRLTHNCRNEVMHSPKITHNDARLPLCNESVNHCLGHNCSSRCEIDNAHLLMGHEVVTRQVHSCNDSRNLSENNSRISNMSPRRELISDNVRLNHSNETLNIRAVSNDSRNNDMLNNPRLRSESNSKKMSHDVLNLHCNDVINLRATSHDVLLNPLFNDVQINMRGNHSNEIVNNINRNSNMYQDTSNLNVPVRGINNELSPMNLRNENIPNLHTMNSYQELSRVVNNSNNNNTNNIYTDYSTNNMLSNMSPRALPPLPPFPYHVVPPPKTKQNISVLRNQMNRSKTPEILLAPHYLDNTRVYYDWADRGHTYRIHDLNDDNNSTLQRRINNMNNEPNSVSDNENLLHDNNEQMHNDESSTNMYKAYRVPSDIDSQISLPRSYTLPREFKYYRRGRVRKQTRNDHFVASTNSSDGDVDSADDNDSDVSSPQQPSSTNHAANQQTSNQGQSSSGSNLLHNKPLRRLYAYRNQVKHETKL